MNRSIILVAASVAALVFGASSASAQDSGISVAVAVGSTSVDQTYTDQDPEGTIVDVRLSDRLFSYDGWNIAAEAGVAYSNASASSNGTFCIDFTCNDIGTWTSENTSTWSGTLGVVVSRPVGSVVVSGAFGVSVAEFTEQSHYDNAGVYPNDSYKDTNVAFGGYYGVRVDYPVNDRWSVGIGWQHSDLTEAKWSSSYGGGSNGFTTETVTVGITNRF